MTSPRFLVPLATRDERQWTGFDAVEQRAQAIRAAEVGGLDGVIAPFDLEGDDSTVVTYDALRTSRWLEVVQELPISFGNPVYAAKTAASAQRFFEGRLAWKLVVDDPGPSQSTPAATTLAARCARATEFLTVVRGVWEHEEFSFSGRYHQVAGGGFQHALAGLPLPRLYLSGTSDEALALSARFADVHVFDDADTAVRRGPELIAAAGRPIAIGARLRIVAREHRDDLPAVAKAEEAVIGSYGEVASTLGDFVERGVSVFLVDLEPRIEETYRFAEHLLPRIRHDDAAPAAVGGAR